jgi:LacI family transcriptional regulator
VSRHIEEAVRVEVQRSAVHPLLDTVLAGSDVTALVGDNDWTALACIHYLREKGVRVPADLSVVGFDNSPDAFAQELTSYDFGGAAMVRAMLSHALGPRSSAPRKRSFEPTEIDGFVSVRRSTAAPARRSSTHSGSAA